jgi:hypothetical protein
MSRMMRVFAAVCLLLAVLTACQQTITPLAAAPDSVVVSALQKTFTPTTRETQPIPTSQAAADEPVANQPTLEPDRVLVPAGEPAGCLTPEEQAQMASSHQMLAYADRLLNLNQPLATRLLPGSWNAVQQRFIHPEDQAMTLAVSGMRYDYNLQKILNALHVAGFAAWLRETPEQQLHILAIPLLDPAWEQGAWGQYIRAYWQDRSSVPVEDPAVIPALKLPPCRWMIERGFAPPVDSAWWASDPLGWPDYARTGPGYLANNTRAANKVAERIDWLGAGGNEGAATMCGPLAWALMADAGAFPPGVGGWSSGPKSYWLAKPSENGRPWSLFEPESYHVYHFERPLGSFDFGDWPLYAGDFFYTYSRGDGFDHMVLVTEVDQAGNIYVITNRVWEHPEKKFTIERVVFANLYDPAIGVAKNDWHADRLNGRTGHAGFDVFRWAWVDKDVKGAAVSYMVQAGDTLGLVAARWRTPAELIARYNGLTMEADLSIGQELMIPPNVDG